MWRSVHILLLLGAVNVRSLQNPYCSMPCNFGGGKTVLHTVCERGKNKCGPDPSCGKHFREIEMTDELRQYILDLHNMLRNNVASGNETRDNQPPATKMMTLKYDKELEFIAQCWANRCGGNPLNHDLCRGTKHQEYVGQNLGFINSTSGIDIKESVHKLIMYWYDEVAIFKSAWVHNTRDRGVKVGHYTQMIWGETDSIGCAMSYYTTPNVNAGTFLPIVYDPNLPEDTIYIPSKVNDYWQHLLLVCNYSPAGNYLGVPLYEAGTSCSRCPKNQPCGEYSSLCGKSVKVKNSGDNFVPFFRF